MAQHDFLNTISSSVLTPSVGMTSFYFDAGNWPNFKDASGNYYNFVYMMSGTVFISGAINCYNPSSDLILTSSTSQVVISGGLKLPLRHVDMATKTVTIGIVPNSNQTVAFDTDVQRFGITRDTTASFYVTRTGLYQVGYCMNMVISGAVNTTTIYSQVISGATAYQQSYSTFPVLSSSLAYTGSLEKTFVATMNSGTSLQMQVFTSWTNVSASGITNSNCSFYLLEIG